MSETKDGKPKGRFTTWLKDAGLVTDDKPTVDLSDERIEKTSTRKTTQTVAPVSAPISSGVSNEKLNAAFTHFLELLDQANLPGPDFYEYSQALRKMKNKPGASSLDEKTLYSMVFESQESTGLTKEVLKSSQHKYLQILKQHYDTFNTNSKNVLDKQVGTKQKEADNLRLSIEDKKKQIAQLQDEINKETINIESINKDITESNENIRQTNEAFLQAYQRITTEFSEIGAKCDQYIQ